MRTSAILSALTAVAVAAPLEARDGPAGLGGLFGGFDPAAIGKLLQNGGLAKLSQLVNPDLMKSYGGMMAKFLSVLPVEKTAVIDPVVRSTAKRIRLIHGPYLIKGTANKNKVGNGFSFDPSGTGYMYKVGAELPRDVTIIATKNWVVDEAFKPIDIGQGLYNHHNIFYDVSTPPLPVVACASGKGGYTIPINAFMGGGTETSGEPYTTQDGKFNAGFYVANSSAIINMLDVVNYNKEDKTVYSLSEVEYVPGKVDKVLPAYSQIIDIGMCDGNGDSGLFIHAPEGKKQWTLNTTDINITQNGYLINGKAHLHDGAVNMQIIINGDMVCDSKAVYGGEGREGKQADGSDWKGIADTTLCGKVVKVKKGDKIKFIANFDIAAHPEREQVRGDAHEDAHSSAPAGGEMGGMGGMGGMGMMGGGKTGEAEGMALFTASFALEAPGTDPEYSASKILVV